MFFLFTFENGIFYIIIKKIYEIFVNLKLKPKFQCE